jgi:hypothetical protein
VLVRLQSVSNEGHFTVEAETVFHPYLASPSSKVSESSHVILPAQALQAVQVTLKSVSNEGHFTIAAETVCRYYLALHRMEVSQT